MPAVTIRQPNSRPVTDVERAVLALPDQQRFLIATVYDAEGGRSYQEAAEIMGMPLERTKRETGHRPDQLSVRSRQSRFRPRAIRPDEPREGAQVLLCWSDVLVPALVAVVVSNLTSWARPGLLSLNPRRI